MNRTKFLPLHFMKDKKIFTAVKILAYAWKIMEMSNLINSYANITNLNFKYSEDVSKKITTLQRIFILRHSLIFLILK